MRVVSQEPWTKTNKQKKIQYHNHTTCFWVHDCFLPVLLSVMDRDLRRCSYSVFSHVWYLNSKKVCGRKLLYRNASLQHSCCTLCVFHCKYSMLHACISLKMGKNRLIHNTTLVSFSPIVGTDGGMFYVILFLFFLKWIL